MTDTLQASSQVGLLDDVRQFLATPRTLLIDGKQLESQSGATFETFDPSSGKLIATVAQAEEADVDAAVRTARSALEGTWAKTSPAERARLLLRLADVIDAHCAELAQLESLDNGTPIAYTQNALVPVTAAHFRHFAGWADKLDGRSVDIGDPMTQVLLEREPVGVVAAIVPWNFPLVLSAWKIAPALAAGCTVVLKPAEQTPLTGLRLGELALEAGIPPGVLNVCTGHGETTGAALVEHGGVDKIAFTGSVEVGQTVARTAAATIKRVSLELGGKSPSIVLADADLDVAVASAAAGIFFNSGQVCSAGSRLLVERPVYDEVVAGIVEAGGEQVVGPALDPQSTMGPLISTEQLQRVTGYVERGLTDGAELLCGGSPPSRGDGGYFFDPTVFGRAPSESAIVREEIFGPVLVAEPFDSIEQIAERANDTPFGLAAAVFSRDLGKAQRLARAIRAGTVWINCYGLTHPAIPFGGYKRSGYGRDGGVASLEQYLETKAIWTSLS